MSKNIHKENILKMVQLNKEIPFQSVKNIWSQKTPSIEEIQAARWCAQISFKGFQGAVTEYVGPGMETPDTQLTTQEANAYIRGEMISILETEHLKDLVEDKKKAKPADVDRMIEGQKNQILSMWRFSDENRMKNPGRYEKGIAHLMEKRQRA